MSNQSTENNHLPVAPPKIAALENCRDLTEKVNIHLVWMHASGVEATDECRRSLYYHGYDVDSYLLSTNYPRFGTGEGEGVINESVHGADLLVMVDVTNYPLTYKADGNENHMSPDDHLRDLERIIVAGDAATHHVNVTMSSLYEGRQHRGTKREPLDCAYMLIELANVGIENFITFGTRDLRVQNAISPSSFGNFTPTHQLIRACFLNIPDMETGKDHLMVISPGEDATDRAIYTSNILGVSIGMFYKRRDYSKVVDGHNPIVAHKFLGASVKDKNVLTTDDMISSGESMMDTARNLKDRGCRCVIVCATFGLLTNDVKGFCEKYDAGIVDYVCTTNLNYHRPEPLKEPWYPEAGISPCLAYITGGLSADISSDDKLSSTRKIQNFLKNLQNEECQYFGFATE